MMCVTSKLLVSGERLVRPQISTHSRSSRASHTTVGHLQLLLITRLSPTTDARSVSANFACLTFHCPSRPATFDTLRDVFRRTVKVCTLVLVRAAEQLLLSKSQYILGKFLYTNKKDT